MLDDLVAALADGYDPVQLSQEELSREVWKEFFKLRHHGDIRNPSAEESAKVIANIAARQLSLNREEREKFEDLYLTILKNRKICCVYG